MNTSDSAHPGVGLPGSLSTDLVDGVVGVLTLARPAKRNALDDETVRGIERYFTTLDPAVRAVVLDAEGSHFCAGLDLAEMVQRDVLSGVSHSQMWHRAFAALEGAPVPVVAALKGAVIGGGLELAAACHIRVAEESTFYAMPEGTRGLFVGGGGSVRIPRLVGLARMTDMMLTGRRYDAEEGVQLGFSQYVVPGETGRKTALELAIRIATNGPQSNLAVLQTLPRIAEANPQTGYLLESLMAAIAQSTDDAKGRMTDFLEGRAAKADGR